MALRLTEEEYRRLFKRTPTHCIPLEGKGDRSAVDEVSSPRKNKFNAVKTEAYGKIFDSAHEAERYGELLLLERAGEIHDLKCQVKYVLIPAKREPDRTGPRGGKIKGKVIERETAYFADFVYKTKDGTEIVEDAKGCRTKDYRIKKKLMLSVHGIRLKEV